MLTVLKIEDLTQAPEVVVTGEPLPVTDAQDHLVAQLWAEARAHTPSLFDGTIADVVAVEARRVLVRSVPYRFAWAALRHSTGDGVPTVRPLAVTGILHTPDGLVLLGRRGPDVTQDPSRWELAPSGGFDPTAFGSLQEQLLAELHEEVGIERAHISPPRAFALVLDEASQVLDVVFTLGVNLSADALRARCLGRVGEYVDFRLVDPQSASIADGNHDLVETSRALLERLATRDWRSESSRESSG